MQTHVQEAMAEEEGHPQAAPEGLAGPQKMAVEEAGVLQSLVKAEAGVQQSVAKVEVEGQEGHLRRMEDLAPFLALMARVEEARQTAHFVELVKAEVMVVLPIVLVHWGFLEAVGGELQWWVEQRRGLRYPVMLEGTA